MDWYQVIDIMTVAKAYMILHPQVSAAVIAGFVAAATASGIIYTQERAWAD